MANGNLRIVSIDSQPHHHVGSSTAQQASYIADSGAEPSPEEALRLIRAFTQISDQRRRARLIEQAEKMVDL